METIVKTVKTIERSILGLPPQCELYGPTFCPAARRRPMKQLRSPSIASPIGPRVDDVWTAGQ
ncbi:MAG: hypothetical protein HYZ28_07245 [Myxococcales bacterium]|nr:hypothetical protein [Myxococcales bacterium]